MSWFILGIFALVAVIFAVRWFARADPKTLVKVAKWTAIALLAALVIGIAVRGALWWLLPMAAAAPMLWRRLGRGWPRMGGAAPSRGKSSDVETQYLRMSLDHDSGTIAGEVLKGRFAGRKLSELAFEDLLSLLSECGAEDPQSASLIEAYLDRVEGKDWRERASQSGHTYEAPRTGASRMSRDEAYEILGLEPGASHEEVKEAHRRLMLKIHPDQGGSNYLATKINLAKDVILESLG